MKEWSFIVFVFQGKVWVAERRNWRSFQRQLELNLFCPRQGHQELEPVQPGTKEHFIKTDFKKKEKEREREREETKNRLSS